MHALRKAGIYVYFVETASIFAVLIAVYSLTFSGTFRADDEHILAARAQSQAFWNTLEFPQVYGNDRVRSLTLVPEQIAPPDVAIEPGQAYLGSILFRLAAQLEVGGVQAFFILNIFATAVTGCVVYLSIIALGMTRRSALFTGLAYGLLTMAWPYSKTGFRDPLAAMFLSISFLGWIIFIRAKSKKIVVGYLIFSISLILALLVKVIVFVFLMALLMSGFLLRTKLNRSRWIRWRWGTLLLTLLMLFAAGLLSGTGTLSRYSIFRYLGLFNRYWHDFDLTILIAFVGPFFSPAKNIFLYSPILLGLPWSLKEQGRGGNLMVIPILLTVILFALAQALHLQELWAGVLFWGLRFMLPTLPLLMILMAPLLERIVLKGSLRDRVVGWSLMCAGFFLQLAGAVVNWAAPFQFWARSGMNFEVPSAVWSFKYNIIPILLKSIRDTNTWDIAWFRTMPVESNVIIIPIMSLILLIIAIFLLTYQDWIRKSQTSGVVIGSCLGILVLVFPIFPGLTLIKSDPYMGGNSREIVSMIKRIDTRAEDSDLIVVDSYGSRLWYQMLNNWRAPVRWYSLPYEIPGTEGVGDEVGGELSRAGRDLFTEYGTSAHRIYYLTSSEAPDYRMLREETWLRENKEHLESVVDEGMWIVKLQIYSP